MVLFIMLCHMTISNSGIMDLPFVKNKLFIFGDKSKLSPGLRLQLIRYRNAQFLYKSKRITYLNQFHNALNDL